MYISIAASRLHRYLAACLPWPLVMLYALHVAIWVQLTHCRWSQHIQTSLLASKRVCAGDSQPVTGSCCSVAPCLQLPASSSVQAAHTVALVQKELRRVTFLTCQGRTIAASICWCIRSGVCHLSKEKVTWCVTCASQPQRRITQIPLPCNNITKARSCTAAECAERSTAAEQLLVQQTDVRGGSTSSVPAHTTKARQQYPRQRQHQPWC